ncbi:MULTISPECIES: dienelactone hydrolase family protein [unclassified Leifsonia]|uniref:dienelactone hydrolase family protein n=1 Tax=unclassified Leifsonia TaxID=2663824 RepID=UPI0006FBA441|nr:MULTISPECIES: dienelactone hydrolase family protein [unclassified Leifsonia]KQX07614.1 dienelactone hydrolase [Leifsonia sp. Root1293]KRA11896.1 dienelactone hydrolase [Leifsonia sp. Root60]
MADVVLFHHAQGLTAGVAAFAEQLTAAGHTVTAPDLYSGHTFDTLDEGLAYAREVGFEKLLDDGVAAGESIGGEPVYLGFSLGVLPAQKLAQTRPEARGAVLLHSFVPVSEFGEAWPDEVPVQVHAMDADTFFVDDGDLDAARDLLATTARAQLFLYPGDAHLFADSSLPDYDEVAAALLTRRVLEFLAGVDGGTKPSS